MCHKQYHHIMDNYIMCLSIVLYLLAPLLIVCAGNSASETVITPEGEEVR